MNEKQPEHKYMRIKKAAVYFDVCHNTLWRWSRERPDFPKPLRLGDRVTLFDITAIEAWMRANK